ncbi:MAG: preprotein translocase subunit SecA [Planctomycetota bacterium]
MATQILSKVAEFAGKIFGSSNERILRELRPIVDKINKLEPEFQKKTDAELRELTSRWQERLSGPKSFDEQQDILEEILPQAFANVREAARRVLITPAPDSPYPTMRPFDVQLVGGIALHRQMIAEMVTGEGKTLVATFAAYLNALTGEGVHLVTVNDYLARRDCEWMGPLYNFLGMRAGFIQSHQPNDEKRAAYACDITYGTNSEFGFDYLRDNMEYEVSDQVQVSRGLHYAIIDEVDNILIDEARTPLIISGPVTEETDKYYAARRVAKKAEPGKDYEVKEKEEACHLTDEGVELAQNMLGEEDLYADDPDVMEWQHFLETALRAKEFYTRDEQYIVRDGEVVIVDEFTGRLMEGRVWSGGLHQAVMVKEGLPLKKETQTIASITLQNFFRLYDKLAGMTGTAKTEEDEFHKIYDLGVVSIPTNLPLRRKEYPDVVYRTQEEKWEAVVDEIEEVHEEGRPVLVGTTSVDKSELLSKMLNRQGLEHEVLNARPEAAAREADIVANAGQPGVVTISTNMAGRGTDIVLGPGVADKGGLHIVGTERHEARRIDNQLRGRAGRQGDPGSSRFFVSFEDDLMRIFAPESMRGWLEKVGMEEGMALESKMVSRWIEKAQKKVEEYNFEIRKNLLEYDEVMDEQRKTVYSWRQKILNRENIEEEIVTLAEDAIFDGLGTYVDSDSPPEDWDLEGLKEWFERKFDAPLNIPPEKQAHADVLQDYLFECVREIYQQKCDEVEKEPLMEFARSLMLRTIDVRWKDHLHAMDVLKSGIGLRGWGQHDPKIAYKIEGGEHFDKMIASIADQFTDMFFRVHVEEREERDVSGVWETEEMQHADFDVTQEAGQQKEAADTAGEEEVELEPITADSKVGRNDPCPCGSGRKYKKCCGKPGR